MRMQYTAWIYGHWQTNYDRIKQNLVYFEPFYSEFYEFKLKAHQQSSQHPHILHIYGLGYDDDGLIRVHMAHMVDKNLSIMYTNSELCWNIRAVSFLQ